MDGEAAAPTLSLRVDGGRTLRFSRAVTVGRGADCDVQVDDHHVSRRHLQLSCANGRWFFTDLQSSNGVYVNGTRVGSGAIGDGLTLYLGGTDGPALAVRVEAASQPPARPYRDADPPAEGGETRMIASYKERYFGSQASDEPAGPRTMMIRKAFREVQERQRRRYLAVIALVTVAGFCAAGYAWHTRRELQRQRQIAAVLFYEIKAHDVSIAREEETKLPSGQPADRSRLQKELAARRETEARYDRFLQQIGPDVYGRALSEREKLILKVTRAFGECELIVPPEYLRKVDGYIEGWRRTQRFSRALTKAKQQGYVRRIVEELIDQGLPPQFFYLAMQESDFNAFAVGTPTNWGYAKGMWQFIAATGSQYKLKIGPLKDRPVFDAEDERFQWEKATRAAARYIKTIYTTEAQASGLLVMASYNWGERRVVRLIATLPDNPRDRNFWKLIARHNVPDETYKYVFSIVSAAAIGENPRLFGVDFDNPIAEALAQMEADAATATRRGVPQVVSASR